MKTLFLKVSFCQESQSRYRICINLFIDGEYHSPICWGDSEQTMGFLCDQINAAVATTLRADRNLSIEEICDLMGIARSPSQHEEN